MPKAAAKRDAEPVPVAAEKDKPKSSAAPSDESPRAPAIPAPASPTAPSPAPPLTQPESRRSDPAQSALPDRQGVPLSTSPGDAATRLAHSTTRPDTASLAPSGAPLVVPISIAFPARPDGALVETFPAAPIEHSAIFERAVDDPGLSVAVLPHAAHLSIVSRGGDLALHVRVREGTADVNVSGTMAPLFDAKAPEVRTVLAGEGLELGSFATGHQNGQQGQPQGQPDPSSNALPPQTGLGLRRPAPASPEVRSISEHGIHVTA